MENNKKELKNLIENLIIVNNNYKQSLENLNQIKENKQNLENKIINLLDELNLNNKTFLLNDNKIQQRQYVQFQSLSLKYIENCLNRYLETTQNIDIKEFIEVIKNNRNKKIKNEIKIT